MINELSFIIHSIIISLFAVITLKIGKEALIALLCVQAILSNLFVTKQMIIFGLCATCSDAFSVGSSLSLNLLQEYYGKNITQKTIWISFFLLIFYLVMTQIHLLYVPASFDTAHSYFYYLFQTTPRIIIASLFSYFVSQQIDSNLYAYFKKVFANKFFILRNYGSLIISQFIDTTSFTFLGLYSIIENPIHILFISFAIKLITIFISIPIVSYLKKFIKKESA